MKNTLMKTCAGICIRKCYKFLPLVLDQVRPVSILEQLHPNMERDPEKFNELEDMV